MEPEGVPVVAQEAGPQVASEAEQAVESAAEAAQGVEVAEAPLVRTEARHPMP